MKSPEGESFLNRWWDGILHAIWSKTSVITFVFSFILAEIIWWVFFDLRVTWGQALEYLIPIFVGALITIFITIIVQYSRVRSIIRKEHNQFQLMMAEQQDEAHIITNWLKLRLTKTKLGISEAYLFGSITHSSYETDDVDVVLLFKEMTQKEYMKKAEKQLIIERVFARTFGKKLHYQRFLVEESNEFHEFVSMQSEPISILEER